MSFFPVLIRNKQYINLAQNKRSKIRTKGCDTTKTKVVRGVKIIQRNINTPPIEENLEVERMYTKIALSEKY